MTLSLLRLAASSVLVLFLAACASAPRGPELLPPEAIGGFHRTVTTASPEAQRWFDQGLALCYGFDHDEATRAFTRATEIDPSCAMAWWGIAYAAGPNINDAAMDEARNRAAHEAMRHAVTIAGGASPVEQALIGALSNRYAWPPPEDQMVLNRAYANAMREVYRAHGDDPDVGALFAESIMNLRPWDFYSPEGEARPETPEIVATLERVLESHPRHPGANHSLIHTVEASPDPARALAAADRLRDLVPAAGHLVHMPSHIDIRLGRYAEAVDANVRALEADAPRVERSGLQGMYAMYHAHNFHFLVYAAMFDGRREVALRAARDLEASITPAVVSTLPAVLEAFVPTTLHVMVRFGDWEAILREPAPGEAFPLARAVSHYARGLAFSATGRVAEAGRERGAFEREAARVPEGYTVGNNPAHTVLAIGRAMLAGEHEYRRGDHDAAFAHLREAVRLDDALRYDEPWGWMQPARHALGALLLEQGRVAEAEEVYRADLVRHPGNGWALHGLAECLRRRGAVAEAETVEARQRESWKRADVTIRASCFCRTGA